jgi:hypothetical protein
VVSVVTLVVHAFFLRHASQLYENLHARQDPVCLLPDRWRTAVRLGRDIHHQQVGR